MGLFEDAVIYATNKHSGKIRKVSKTPAILHSMEVAQIISTMTNEQDVIIAGLLHDVVEDTEGTLDEIKDLFGDRVAWLVDSETENKYEGQDKSLTWKKRKEDSIKKLIQLNDRNVQILWLADKLSNIRSLANDYSERGDKLWQSFHQSDPLMHKWYYKTIAEALEMQLNRTGAFKEYVLHINSIWAGTFASDKTGYKKYREVSIDGCRPIGRGAKSEVYQYDDELAIKVYNEENQYKDIERENNLARQAFVAGIPTAITFGIVKVGNRYGTMFELLEPNSVSSLIANNPSKVKEYAVIMADIAKRIHSIKVEDYSLDVPNYIDVIHSWIDSGIEHVDSELANKIRKMVDEIPNVNTLIHGDFHTGNVMTNRGEYILIDMDSVSACHPIAELSGIYMFYVAFGEEGGLDIPIYMGYSYDVRKQFFNEFMKSYLGRDDIDDVVNKAALLCYVRLVRRCFRKGYELSDADLRAKDYYMEKIKKLLQVVDSFLF